MEDETDRALEILLERLDRRRRVVLGEVAGLTEKQARRSTVPSGTNLAGRSGT